MKVRELMAALSMTDPEHEVYIDDADTRGGSTNPPQEPGDGWLLAIHRVDLRETVVVLAGEYHGKGNIQ